MSERGEPSEPGESAGAPGPEERGGEGGRAEGAAREEVGGGADAGGRAGSAGRGEEVESGVHTTRFSRLSATTRIAVSILGPALLTTAYFTIPFGWIGPQHRVLSWLILAGLLTALAVGMVAITNRVLTGQSGRDRYLGVGILLLSWAAILVFSASYWALATRHGQFVGLQTRLDALYFTGVTMATVGYGDVHPSGQVARAVVLVQLVYTFVFLVGGVTALRARARDRFVRRSGEGGA